MDWKNQFTKTPYLVLFIVLITVGVGTASALITITLAGDVIITDDLLVEGGAKITGSSIISERNSVNTDNLVIQRPEGATADTTRFVLSHRTNDKDLWLYGFDGTTFKNFVGFDYPNYKINFPATSNTLVVDAANDRVGIGTSSPTEVLDIVGNVIISGDLDTVGTIECPNCILGFYEVEQQGPGDPDEIFSIIAECDSGDTITGGGHFNNIVHPPFAERKHSISGERWVVFWSGHGGSGTFTAFAQCADYPPPHIP